MKKHLHSNCHLTYPSRQLGLESGGSARSRKWRVGSDWTCPVDFVDFIPEGGGEPEEDPVGLPGLRRILQREMRFVLRSKLPYKAARSCPAALSSADP